MSDFWFNSYRCYALDPLEPAAPSESGAVAATSLANEMVYDGILAGFVATITEELVTNGFEDVGEALRARLEG